MGKIGLIAGNGRFPVIFAKEASLMGHEVIAVAHKGESLPDVEKYCAKTVWIKVGQLGKLISVFKEEGVRDAVMAGGITKTRLFTDVIPDWRAVKLLASVKDKKDDAILRAIAGDLEREGIQIRDSLSYLSSLLVTEGVLTRKKPDKQQIEDVEFGWNIAKKIGELDIGQTVVVRKSTVLAIEAIEGTDSAIERGGRLCDGGAVVVKVCKPGQDLRFDLPTIGPDTIRKMSDVKAALLAVEAGKTILIDREETLSLANQEGISIIGVNY